MTNGNTDFQRSAGGVLFREARGGVLVCLIQQRGRTRRWQLPKGHIEPGETAEQAAAREVEEETGYKGHVIEPIDRIRYDFVWRKGRKKQHVDKEVSFFLMRHEGGDPIAKDSEEIRHVGWFALDEVLKYASFEGEKSILQKASARIREIVNLEA